MYVPMPVIIFVGILILALALMAVRPRRDGKGWRDGDDLMRPPLSRVPAPAPRAVLAPRPGEMTPEATAQVAALLRDGQVISAVKLVRETTGLGLAEAKAIVDDMR